MKRMLCIAGLAVVLAASASQTAQAQIGFGVGPGFGYSSAYGGFVPGYSSGINLSVGRGIGFSSGYGYTGPYGLGYYGAYRPYGVYGPVGPSGYGVGYSFVGPPVYRAPIYRPRPFIRRHF